LSINVKAKEYTETFIDKSEWISGDYVNKEKGGSTKYQQMYTIKRRSDKKFVYCIEPGVSIKDGKIVKGYDEDYLDVTKFTQEEWDRINKLSYYGYGYKDSKYNHTGIHWYTITQFMIWKTVPNGYNIYFTDTLNGKKITKYTKEMNEMEEILSNYHKLPSFNNKTYKFITTENKEIIDTNNVLSSFNTSNNLTIDDNKVIINETNKGTYNYTFNKINNKYGVLPIVYIDSESQNLMSVGDINDDIASLKVIIYEPKVKVYKRDIDNMKAQGEGTLEGAEYGIYKYNGNLIGIYRTNDRGYFISDTLPFGDYYIKEIKPSIGYLLDDKMYKFTINEDNLEPIINVYEKVIMGKLEINKYLSSHNSDLKKESGAKFAIYDKNDNLYKEAITDSNGYILFNLPYGTYTIKQLSTTTNYQKVSDFKITIDKEKTIKKELIDELYEAKIKVIKKDLETNNIIQKEGFIFKIYDIDHNKYLCENDDCTYKTNNEGYFITKYYYPYGNYKLEEVNTLKEYYLNKESIEFKIDNLNVYEISFYNKEIKGSLEFTKLDYSNSKPIPNTLIEIYKDNDELIYSGRTDNNGKIIINGLKIGKYYIIEKEAPIGYLLNDNKMYFEILDDRIVKASLTNERIIGSIKITKIGEEAKIDNGYYYIDNYLNDIEFSLFAKEDIMINNEIIYKKNELVNKGKTNNKGELIFNNLVVGNYYLKETNTKDGYLINNQVYNFNIKENKEYKINIKNYLKKGVLEFTKTSISDSIPLPNTLMEFYDINDNLILSERTDIDGKIRINLPYGKYYFLEKEAPIGYYLNPDKHYFEIIDDNKIVYESLSDDKIIVPDTYKDQSFNYYSLILIGVLYVFIKKIFI